MFVATPTPFFPYRSANGICDGLYYSAPSALYSQYAGFGTAGYVSTSANQANTDGYFFVSNATMEANWVVGTMSPFIYPSIMVRSKFNRAEAWSVFTPNPTKWKNGELVWDGAYGMTLGTSGYQKVVSAADGADSNWRDKTPYNFRETLYAGILRNSCFRMNTMASESEDGMPLDSVLSWTPVDGKDSYICDWQCEWDTADFKAAHTSALSGMDAHTQENQWVPPYEIWRGTDDCMLSFTFDRIPKFSSLLAHGHTEWVNLSPHGFGKSIKNALQFEACFFFPLMYIDKTGNGTYDVWNNSDMPSYQSITFKNYNDYTVPSELVAKAQDGTHTTRPFGTPIWEVTFNGFPDGVIPDAKETAKDYFDKCGMEPFDVRYRWYCAFIADEDYFNDNTTSVQFQTSVGRTRFDRARSGKDNPGKECAIFFAGTPDIAGDPRLPVYGFSRGTFCKGALDQVGTNSKWEYGRFRMWVDGMTHESGGEQVQNEYLSDARPRRGVNCTLTQIEGEGGGTITLTYAGVARIPFTAFPNGLKEMGETTILDGAFMGMGAFEIGRFAIPVSLEGEAQ